MTSKADKLGASSSFAAAGARSERRKLIEGVTGETPPSEPPRIAPLADLAHNPFNPRTDLGDLQETADSLLERGQIQPITVITRERFLEAHPGHEADLEQARYVVLDGNRRFAAARLAGLETLRVDVNDDLADSAVSLLESSLIANLHREDITHLDEAETLAELVKVHGSQRQVARRLGKSHIWVGQRLALLDLKPELQEELRAGVLKVEDARRIGRLDQQEQTEAAEEAKLARETRPARSRGKAKGGNAVSTPGQTETSRGGGNDDGSSPPDNNSDDLASLAARLRQRLRPAQRRELAALLLQDD